MMLKELHADALSCVLLQTDVVSLMHMRAACKLLKTTIECECLAYQYACRLYSVRFWDLAQERPLVASLPLSRWIDEIIRIEYFQRICVQCYGKRYQEDDFYRLWECL